ncbi:hypothetical protein ILYODFUR_037026 [Ilyodon furcidens]|uniref:Uncharacterized protein n=1 Tax=Ilyodon furcidens TaxID=33524 RepID=A0ABV0TG08_9TELE
MLLTHSHSPYSLYTPRFRQQNPIGATSFQTEEVVPFIPDWRQGDHLSHQFRLGLDPNHSGPEPSPPLPNLASRHPIDCRPHPETGPKQTNKPANQRHPRMKQSYSPNEF